MRFTRSLLWQLGAFALAVSVLSLVLHVAVISIWLRPMLDQLISQLVSRTQIAHALIEAAPAAEREAVARRIGDDEFRVVAGRADDFGVPGPPPPMQDVLTTRLGPGYVLRHDTRSAWSTEPRHMYIGFTVDGQPWTVELRAEPPIHGVLGTGIGWLALAAVAVATSLLIGLNAIVKPIRQVAARIALQGSALRPLALPQGASAELHALVEAFNRLAERVQAADRDKQHLLAGVSHDLRTPLARLRLRIETQGDAALATAAEGELRAVEHIVSQFLAFVHGESHAGVGADASLLATAGDVVHSYADRGHEVKLLVAAADRPLGALAVQRLLTNLIDNALAHGQPPIDVIWRERDGRQELSVWDHGPGLGPAQFEEALEPFVRLSKDAAIGHCGLGLAIVARIAQQSEATLECRRDELGRFGIVVAWSRDASTPADRAADADARPAAAGTAAAARLLTR